MRIPKSQLNGAPLAIPLAVALFLLTVKSAEAHARFLRSEPGQSAIISAEPQRVDMWFTQDLFRRQGENWIMVLGPRGDEVQSGETQIDDDDRHHMWVELISPLEPGEYSVQWRNLSAEDGDNDEGDFVFTLDPLAEVTSTPMLNQTETPVPSPPPVATATSAAASPSVETTAQPVGENKGGCFLGLTPAFGLAALGLGLKRRYR